jgi:hypothetical protein
MTANRLAQAYALLIGVSAALCLASALAAAPTPQTPKVPAPKAAAALSLAVSVLDVMRASVQIPADGIWGAAGGDKLTDDEWLLAEQDATNLVAAATLIAIPGTGRNDRQWAASPDWQNWVREFKRAALDLHAAARAHDLAKLSAAGDRLTKVCEDCHAKYRPAAPSDGVSRYPFYPKRELPAQ